MIDVFEDIKIKISPDADNVIRHDYDFLGMRIYGRITDDRNIRLLQRSQVEEMRTNDPTIAYRPVGEKYIENKAIYKKSLYEAEKDLVFVDVDVFRQPALYYKDNGYYCPFDEEKNPADFNAYWDLQLERRKNGMTAWAGIDKEGNRRKVYIPGNMYGFINFGPITKVEDDDDATNNDDLFKEDKEEERNATMALEDLIKELGVRTVEIGVKTVDFPNFFDGQYHLIIAKNFARIIGKNFFFGKARRKGCSYFNAWDLFNDMDLNPYIAVILAAFDKKYLIHGKGLMKMLYTYADFMAKATAFNKDRLISNKEHLKFGYTYEGEKIERGYLSEALAVSAQNNPDVTIGKDVYHLAYEELGKFPNFKDSFEVTTSTAEAGDRKTGHICGWGTGGTDEANWAAFEDVYYNPAGYDALECNNVWDNGLLGTPSCYFYPHVQALEGHMDYNGNTNYETAWASYKEKKEIKRKEITDSTSFEKWCGQRANCGLEAFAKSGSNVFNREAIMEQLRQCEHNPRYQNIARQGVMVDSGTGKHSVRLKMNQEIEAEGRKVHKFVDSFPLKKDTDVYGCWIEWMKPYYDRNGNIPDNMYVAFQDPYAHDKDPKSLKLTDSLGATYIFENLNPYSPYGGGIPVAAYIGRPDNMDYYNDQVLLGLRRYNAKMLFENDRGDTKPFFQKRRALEWLYEEPSLQFAKDLQGKTGRGYGMHMTDQRKAKGAIYLRDMLNTIRGYDRQGNAKTLLHYVFDKGFLRELLRWDIKGNFDRVSAWLVGMYIIKEIEYLEMEEISNVYEDDSLFNRELY